MTLAAREAGAVFADVVYADQGWVDAECAEIVDASLGGPPAPPPPAPPRVPPRPGTPPPPSRRPARGPAVLLFRPPGRPVRPPRPSAERPGPRQQPCPSDRKGGRYRKSQR